MTDAQWQTLSLITSMALLVVEIYIYHRLVQVLGAIDGTKPLAVAIGQSTRIVMLGIIIYQVLRVTNGLLTLTLGDFTFEVRQVLIITRDTILGVAFVAAFLNVKRVLEASTPSQT